MKIILKTDIKNLGQKGEEKEVKPGYARNFLFPRNLAVSADSIEAKTLSLAKKEEDGKKQENLAVIKKAISRNSQLQLNFKRKAAQSGKLFGSVKIEEINKELEKVLGFKAEEFKPNSPIKKTGEYKFNAKFGPEVFHFLVIVKPA